MVNPVSIVFSAPALSRGAEGVPHLWLDTASAQVGNIALSLGERVSGDGAFSSRRRTGEALLEYIPSRPRQSCFAANCSVPPEAWVRPKESSELDWNKGTSTCEFGLLFELTTDD
jgi:hypothetical protein